jgi:Flp pilus assembly protein CpaB
VIARRWLIALAILAGVVAGGIYYAGDQRVDVVVAARDIDVPRTLTRDDVELRSVPAQLAAEGIARTIEDVIGLVPRAPLLRGQIVFARGVASEPADFRTGIPLAPGMRAIALPVSAANALGGAIMPGARVDVLAVPVAGRAPAGRATELLMTSATVLDVRGESGTALVARDPRSSPVVPLDRIAAVVIAISPVDEIRFADRVATSTFVLALTPAR